MLWKKLTEKYGLEWSDKVEITEEFGEDSEYSAPQNDTKKIISICLINARLVSNDGVPILIPETSFIFIGSLGAAYNKTTLQQTNITHVLCLSSVVKIMFPDDFIYKRVSMKDIPEFDFLAHLSECLAFIENCRQYDNGRGNILVHCYQGKSRSVAVVMAYLIRTFNYTVDQSLSLIKSVRPIAQPNSGFMNALVSFR